MTRRILTLSFAALVLHAQGMRVLQTNSAGDNVTVARAVLLGSAALVAVTVTVCTLVTLAGAV